MNADISHILDNWPYKPGQVTARKIRGRDGREKIQLRLDLGLIQMEASGRPDGQRPHGCDSLLDWHEHCLRKHRQQRGSDQGFELDPADCELLRAEGVMYYHRYLAEFVLGDYGAVERDTARNLRLMDLCRQFAREESDRFALEPYRPYVLMMRARARAEAAMRENRPKAALAAVRKAIQEIESLSQQAQPYFGGEDGPGQSRELAALRQAEKEIESALPVDPVERLRQELARAVQEERYERAAEIRDELQRLAGADPAP